MAKATDRYERLRELAALSATRPSPMIRGVDMSPPMVAARLQALAEVSALCLRLAAAGAAARRG